MFGKKNSGEKRKAVPAGGLRSASAGMARDELERLTLNHRHARRMMQKSLVAAASMAVTLMFLAPLVVFLALNQPAPRYIAVTSDFRVVSLPTMKEPFVDERRLINWVIDKVTDTISLDHKHYNDTLMRVREAYTDKAFRGIVGQLNKKMIPMIKERGLVASASVGEAAPVIEKEGVIQGVYHWLVRFPMQITYDTSEGPYLTERFDVRALVRRMDPRKRDTAIAIRRLNLDPM